MFNYSKKRRGDKYKYKSRILWQKYGGRNTGKRNLIMKGKE